MPEVDETGTTFEDNAGPKAVAASMLFDGWVIADDSGIEVDALGGAPGFIPPVMLVRTPPMPTTTLFFEKPRGGTRKRNARSFPLRHRTRPPGPQTRRLQRRR